MYQTRINSQHDISPPAAIPSHPSHPLPSGQSFRSPTTALKLVVLPECGHVPHEERAEDFLKVVLDQLGGGEDSGAATTTSYDLPAAGQAETLGAPSD